MLNEDEKEELLEKAKKVIDSHREAKKQTLLRMWIEENDKINALNYWYYRYLTSSFEDYLIRKSEVLGSVEEFL